MSIRQRLVSPCLLLVTCAGPMASAIEDTDFDVMNPPAPCEDQLRGYKSAFAEDHGDLHLFQWVDIHQETPARMLFHHYYRALWPGVGTRIAGDLRIITRAGEPMIVYYGDRRLPFFDREDLVREDHGSTTTLTVRGTDVRFVFEFGYDGRRTLEVWWEEGYARPVRLFSARSGREWYKRY